MDEDQEEVMRFALTENFSKKGLEKLRRKTKPDLSLLSSEEKLRLQICEYRCRECSFRHSSLVGFLAHVKTHIAVRQSVQDDLIQTLDGPKAVPDSVIDKLVESLPEKLVTLNDEDLSSVLSEPLRDMSGDDENFELKEKREKPSKVSKSKRKSDVLKPVLKQEVAQTNKKSNPVQKSEVSDSKTKRRRESKVRFDDFVYGSETGEDTESGLVKKSLKRKFSNESDNESLSENKPLSRKKSKTSESLENSISKKVTASSNHRSPKSKDNSFLNNNNYSVKSASRNDSAKKPRGRPKRISIQEEDFTPSRTPSKSEIEAILLHRAMIKIEGLREDELPKFESQPEIGKRVTVLKITKEGPGKKVSSKPDVTSCTDNDDDRASLESLPLIRKPKVIPKISKREPYVLLANLANVSPSKSTSAEADSTNNIPGKYRTSSEVEVTDQLIASPRKRTCRIVSTGFGDDSFNLDEDSDDEDIEIIAEIKSPTTVKESDHADKSKKRKRTDSDSDSFAKKRRLFASTPGKKAMKVVLFGQLCSHCNFRATDSSLMRQHIQRLFHGTESLNCRKNLMSEFDSSSVEDENGLSDSESDAPGIVSGEEKNAETESIVRTEKVSPEDISDQVSPQKLPNENILTDSDSGEISSDKSFLPTELKLPQD